MKIDAKNEDVAGDVRKILTQLEQLSFTAPLSPPIRAAQQQHRGFHQPPFVQPTIISDGLAAPHQTFEHAPDQPRRCFPRMSPNSTPPEFILVSHPPFLSTTPTITEAFHTNAIWARFGMRSSSRSSNGIDRLFKRRRLGVGCFFSGVPFGSRLAVPTTTPLPLTSLRLRSLVHRPHHFSSQPQHLSK